MCWFSQLFNWLVMRCDSLSTSKLAKMLAVEGLAWHVTALLGWHVINFYMSTITRWAVKSVKWGGLDRVTSICLPTHRGCCWLGADWADGNLLMSVLVNVSTILDEWYNECTHGSLSLGSSNHWLMLRSWNLRSRQYIRLSTGLGLLCLMPLFTTFIHWVYIHLYSFFSP